ncbi:hypothetical protein EDB86DRAFT_2831352 [Lactarius hatsudake]|nr:hypothetical protein EDB86DRAFT_2831352 [Lactarius hatsudake]
MPSRGTVVPICAAAAPVISPDNQLRVDLATSGSLGPLGLPSGPFSRVHSMMARTAVRAGPAAICELGISMGMRLRCAGLLGYEAAQVIANGPCTLPRDAKLRRAGYLGRRRIGLESLRTHAGAARLGTGTVGRMGPAGLGVADDWKRPRTLPRDAKVHRGGRLDLRRVALESLGPHRGAAHWGTWGMRGEKSKCAKCAKRPQSALRTLRAKIENVRNIQSALRMLMAVSGKRSKHPKRTKHMKCTRNTMSNQKAWGHVHFGSCAGDTLAT